MIIIDEVCLDRFRRSERCEYCNRPTPDGTDPHHAFIKRGMGGGSRLDVPCNLAGLCRGYYCGLWVSCHQAAHEGRIHPADIQAIIARREGMLQDQIWEYLYELLRRPKCEAAEEDVA